MTCFSSNMVKVPATIVVNYPAAFRRDWRLAAACDMGGEHAFPPLFTSCNKSIWAGLLKLFKSKCLIADYLKQDLNILRNRLIRFLQKVTFCCVPGKPCVKTSGSPCSQSRSSAKNIHFNNVKC